MKSILFKLLTVVFVIGLINWDKQQYAAYKERNQPYQQILDDQGEALGRVTQVAGGTVHYTFEANGKTYKGNIQSERFSKDAQVPVSYYRQNPGNNVIGNPRAYMGSWGSLALFLGINAAVLGLAFVLLLVG